MTVSDQPIDTYLSAVASTDVTPAAGSSIAVVGATGTALCEMACIHSLRGDAANDRTELSTFQADLEARRATLLALADSDSEVIDEWLSVSHDGVDETETKQTIGVPLAIAEACLDVVTLTPAVAAMADPPYVPDACTGALVTHCALQAAVFVVRTNLGGLADRSFADDMERRTTEIERSADQAFERVTATMAEQT